MERDGVRVQQLPAIHIVTHGRQRAGKDAGENIAGAGSRQRCRARQRQEHTLNTANSRRWPLGDDDKVIGARSPDNLLCGSDCRPQIVDLVTGDDRSEENIIPGAFDPRVAEAVANAVAKAARESGVARL